MCNNHNNITITVFRPSYGVSILSCTSDDLRKFPSLKIFPDNKGPSESSFPGDSVSITIKPQGHIVVARQHMEKWVLSGASNETVDLGSFSNHWKGCFLILTSD